MAFMRHNNNGRRHGGGHHRHHRPNQNQQGGQNQGQRRTNRINQVFESNGPDGRIRGTAQQIVEKYMTLARDAAGSGDKVLSLNYFQHAEHYQRLLNEILEENGIQEREREQWRQQQAQQPDLAPEAAAEGFPPSDQPAAAQPVRQQRQPQSQVQDDDDNSLPGFLQVPITQSTDAADPPRPRRAAPQQSEQADERPARSPRPRRAASNSAADE